MLVKVESMILDSSAWVWITTFGFTVWGRKRIGKYQEERQCRHRRDRRWKYIPRF